MKHKLIAHRGDMVTYPENSLLAFKAAADLGFKNIELDIQVSEDMVPIAIHDESLKRTTGSDQLIRNLTADKIIKYQITTSKEIQNELQYIATLDQVVELINHYRDIKIFVEVKRQSVEYFGTKEVADAVMNVLKNARFKFVIISFSDDFISYVKQFYNVSTGWVLKKIDNKSFEKISIIQPDYLFCNYQKINMDAIKLYKGKWVLYDIQDPQLAIMFLAQGVSYIETGDIKELTSAHEFK